MEVEILISRSLDKISSACNLTTAIGVPPGAKLRLFRHPVRAGQSRMVVCCDKPTASHLRHRFSAPRVYSHDGQLLTLTFVGMRPIADRHPGCLQRGLYNGATATAQQQEGGTAAAGGRGGRGAQKSSCSWVLPPPRSSPAGVEVALEWVEKAQAKGRRVPGIADLYEEFMRNRTQQYNGGEDKLGEFMEDRKECPPSAAKTIHTQRQPLNRWWSGEGKKGEEDEEEKGKEEKHGSVTKALVGQRILSASHKQRCSQRYVVVSVEDATTALRRISRAFADAPKPVERIGVVSLLAKMYADGTAFADNLTRCCEALDRLGIVRWHARTYPRLPAQATAAATMAPRSTAPGKGWLRVLGRVVGLVRTFIDFGAFVQVYVAAAERERLAVSSTTAAVNEEKTRDKQGPGERETRMSRQRGGEDVSPRRGDSGSTKKEDRYGLDVSRDSPDLRASPETTDATAETIEHHHQGGKEKLPVGTYPLPWLFPSRTEEGGRLAFNRHALCGSAVHTVITLEAVARIIRDAGKVFPSERAWRWCCETKTLEGGRLLTFKDFVEMCEGLKEYMSTASLMSPEDPCTSTAVSPVTTVELP